MEHFGLSASSFADKISVQRSSISHLLSGRNKPSLDFVMKISDLFPELNLYWLLDGTGSYLKNDNDDLLSEKIKNTPTPSSKNDRDEPEIFPLADDKTTLKKEPVLPSENSFSKRTSGKELYKVVLFYTDGTFEDFKPNSTK